MCFEIHKNNYIHKSLWQHGFNELNEKNRDLVGLVAYWVSPHFHSSFSPILDPTGSSILNLRGNHLPLLSLN